MTNSISHAQNKGNLEKVSNTIDLIVIDGWASSIGGGLPIGFHIKIAETVIDNFDIELNLESPDVNTVWPELDNASGCRFRLHLPLGEELHGVCKDAMVNVAPIYSFGTGIKLVQVLNPSIPEPPSHLSKIVGAGFHEASLEFLDYFINLGKLKRTDDVLDVGCGIGRMSYGLLTYLDKSAKYSGFDIIPELISWAQNEISRNHPQFQFEHAPIFNSFYNPGGNLKATEFIFPYNDQSFNFFFLTSVFTHMPGDSVQHYLKEIRRVLKPGGRGLITAFMLDESSKALIKDGKSTLELIHPMGDGLVADIERPDYAIGFDEHVFDSWLLKYELRMESIQRGSWCGRLDYLTYQDVLIIKG